MKVYRVLDAASNATFKALHDAIFHAFDRNDPHLYSFYMTGVDTKSIQRIRRSPEIAAPAVGVGIGIFGPRGSGTSAAKARIRDFELEEGDVFHYLFDYGDEWWHRILVEAVLESEISKKSGVVHAKSIGASPPQYSDFD